jgi:hypothetical protein
MALTQTIRRSKASLGFQWNLHDGPSKADRNLRIDRFCLKRTNVDLASIADEIQIAPEMRALIARYSQDEFLSLFGAQLEREIVPISNITAYLHAGLIGNVLLYVSARDEE